MVVCLSGCCRQRLNIEMLLTFKYRLKGTYVSVDPVHLDRYLDEQAFRFNERGDNDGGRFRKVVSSAAGKRLTYRDLTGDDRATAPT